MKEILRNMWRRKFRTLLTVIGITVGIFAFTVMGSMALRFNKMISGGKSYITGQITLMPKGTNFQTGSMGTVLPINLLNEIATVEGVEAVAAGVELAYDEPNPDDPVGGASFGVPATIEGMDLNSDFENRNWKTLDMKEGRMLERGDGNDKAVAGITIATDKGVGVGDKLTVRGHEFEIIGVIDQTLTGPDSYFFVPLPVAREMMIESNPFLKSLKEQADEAANISESSLAQLPEETRNQILQAKAFSVEDVTTAASVSWKDGYDPEQVVENIKAKYKDEVLVLSPTKLGEQIDQASAIFNAVILGSALIALVVGGFSIINTMIMSISERTKEIGIKKALGASRRQIAWEYTLEAGAIGLFGGIIGLGIGLLTITLINSKTAAQGAEIFLIDLSFSIGVIVFSFALGIIAGVLPAVRASKLKVVEALREL